MIGALLTLFAVGLVSLVIAGVVLVVVGTVLGLAFGIVPILLKVGLIMLVGWGVLKYLDRRNDRTLSASDRRWLEKEL